MQPRGQPSIEVGHHRLQGGDEDAALVGEVVMKDALADAGLSGDGLHAETGGAVAGEATDGGVHDLLASDGSHPEPGRHAASVVVGHDAVNAFLALRRSGPVAGSWAGRYNPNIRRWVGSNLERSG